jgi:hypothetical protein
MSKDLPSDDDDEPYDPNKVKKRGNHQTITVKKSKW